MQFRAGTPITTDFINKKFATKADTDLRNVDDDIVAKIVVQGTIGNLNYIKYSNGKLEIWGIVTSNTLGYTVNLPSGIAFRDTNYSIQATLNRGDPFIVALESQWSIFSGTSFTFVVQSPNGVWHSGHTVRYHAIGWWK